MTPWMHGTRRPTDRALRRNPSTLHRGSRSPAHGGLLLASWAIATCVLAPGCLHPRETQPMRGGPPQGSTLAERLEYESVRSVEPFLSEALREAEAAGPAALDEIEHALASTPDQRSFLALVALRHIDRARYEALAPDVRAQILMETLRHHVTFNSWGLPGRAWAEPAAMLLELGAVAAARLRPLLADDRPAPHWGSAGATIAREEGDRVKDYAAALLAEACGLAYVHDPDPAVRDGRIRDLAATAP